MRGANTTQGLADLPRRGLATAVRTSPRTVCVCVTLQALSLSRSFRSHMFLFLFPYAARMLWNGRHIFRCRGNLRVSESRLKRYCYGRIPDSRAASCEYCTGRSSLSPTTFVLRRDSSEGCILRSSDLKFRELPTPMPWEGPFMVRHMLTFIIRHFYMRRADGICNTGLIGDVEIGI